MDLIAHASRLVGILLAWQSYAFYGRICSTCLAGSEVCMFTEFSAIHLWSMHFSLRQASAAKGTMRVCSR